MQRVINLIHEGWIFLLQLLTFILLYLTPISNFVNLVLVLIACDLITGIYASLKEGQKFKASKLRDTLEKFIFYSIAIIIAYLLQSIVHVGSEMPRIVALYIGSIEVKSTYENISRITKTDIATSLWLILKEKLDIWIVELKSKKDTQ